LITFQKKLIAVFYTSAQRTDASTGSETSPQPTSNTSPDSNNFLSDCFDQTSALAIVSDANDELKRYLQSNDNLVDDDEDLLLFWKRQKVFFPILYSIAREILIIPATNTAVERLFSASGNTITTTRTRLSAEKVDKLMFIKKNLSILKTIFVKDEKLNHLDTHGYADATATKGEKRSHDDDDDDNDNDDDIIYTGDTI
jgi:hypothetical protein